MALESVVDVAVVGNGVLGLSVAVEVARRAPRLRVAVIGPTDREGAATEAAGAMNNCFGEVTTHTDRHPASRAKFAIAREALAAWPAWRDMLAETAEPETAAALTGSGSAGTFIILSSASGRIAEENFEAISRALVQHHQPHQSVDPSVIEGLNPQRHLRPLRTLHLPGEGAIDARSVLSALETAARARDIQLVPTTAHCLIVRSGSIRGVRLADGGTLTAGTVVVAAGSMSLTLIDGVLPPGAVPPMFHGTGLAAIARRPHRGGAPDVIRTPNRAASCGMHVVPLPGPDRQYIGATSVITAHPPIGPELGTAADLLQAVCTQIDQDIFSARVERWLCGRRPIPLDCFPLIGPVPSLPGLILATGTYRDGFHCSPVIARHLADIILDPGPASRDTDFDCLRPERPPIWTMNPRQAVTETVRHYLDALDEHGHRIPPVLTEEPLADSLHRRTQQLYEQLRQPAALPPEIALSEFVLPSRDAAGPGQLTQLNDYLDAARRHHVPAEPDPTEMSCSDGRP
ncbi:FAD-dependent oxidoreductase [Streptomyces flavidovirens]|uniref:NAD(P)/FAD-dependent oxidoreductase n=1 Tax=Streptomyces flavidovirens TaxID=67298 RepID=UPI00344A35CA